MSLSGQTAEQRERLMELSEQFARRFAEEKAEALRLADSLGWPVRQEFEDGRVIELMRIREDGMPMYYNTHNKGGGELINSDKVYPGGSAGLNLTGAGQTLGIWDGGAVRLTHQEFQTNGTSRVTQKDGATSLSNHATHVAGTMVAGGVTSSARGMSHEAFLDAHDWNDDDADMALAAANGLQVSQHSYGYITGWRDFGGTWYWYGTTSISETEDYKWGFYSTQARDWDEIAFEAPNYLIVKSAGNDRGKGPAPGTEHYYISGQFWVSSTKTRDKDGGDDGYQSISHAVNSKNIMSVGAVEINGEMSAFSGWGPTDDGRIKPDIVAKGVWVLSPIAVVNSSPSDVHYAYSSGTSMSGPMVSGSVGLLLEHQENLHPGEKLLASTIKALILHSADSEIGGEPGPDYSFGWGLMDTEAAVGIMTKNADMGGNFHIREMTLNDQETIELTVYASGEEDLVATIVWTDPPGTPPPQSLNPTDLMLVNDLDMRLTSNVTKTEYKPYILDPENPSAAATTGDNFRDNVEQIHISEPENGEAFTLTITHKDDLDDDSQDFSLIITGIAPVTYAGNSANWHDPENWQYGSPEETEHIMIPGGLTHFPIIPDEVTINNLSIEAGASLSLASTASVTIKGKLVIQDGAGGKEAEGELIIEAGGSLTVSGTITTTAGNSTMVLKSDEASFASLIHNTPGVPAEVHYHLKGAPGDWQQISPPVEAQEIDGDFAADGIFFAWHEASQAWVSSQDESFFPAWSDANQGETALVPMQGYMAAWNGQEGMKSFHGGLNTGTYDFPLANLAHPEDEFAGFNLMGNPYPSYIDWKKNEGWANREELLEQSGENGYSIWLWDAESRNYGAYNSASVLERGTLSASRYLAPAQGFWVRALEGTAGGTISINDMARTHVRPSDAEGKEYPGPGWHSLRLSVSNKNDPSRDEVLLEFGHHMAGHTDKVMGMDKHASQLFLGHGDHRHSIRLFPPLNGPQTIPMGFKPAQSAAFHLNATGAEGFPGDVLLFDLLTGEQQNLKSEPNYQFEASTGDPVNRFELWIGGGDMLITGTDDALDASHLQPLIYTHGKNLIMERLLSEYVHKLHIYDTGGRLLLQEAFTGNRMTIGLPFPAGVYLLSLKNEEQLLRQPIIVR